MATSRLAINVLERIRATGRMAESVDEALAPVREALDNAIAAMQAAVPYAPRDLEIALRERVKAAKQVYNSLKIED